jgi:hypothetical protein
MKLGERADAEREMQMFEDLKAAGKERSGVLTL